MRHLLEAPPESDFEQLIGWPESWADTAREVPLRLEPPRERLSVDHQIFTRCTEKQLRSIQRMGTQIRQRPGDVLAEEGEVSRQVLVVVEGTASALGGPNRSRFTKGDHIGGFEVMDRRPQPETVVAATPMVIDVYHPGEFCTILGEHPTVKEHIDHGRSLLYRDVR